MDHARPLRAQSLRLRGERRRIGTDVAHQYRVAERDGAPLDLPADADPGGGFERFGPGELQRAPARRVDDREPKRVLARLVDAGGNAQYVVRGERRQADHPREHRLAERKRARLVDDQRIDLPHGLERFGIPEQHAAGRSATAGHHHRHRRREPERARARDDQHRNRGEDRVGAAWFGANQPPDDRRHDRDADDGKNEIARDAIGQALHRRSAALRLRNHPNDLREDRLGPDLLRSHDHASGAVDRRADDTIPGRLPDRNCLAGQHRFVDARTAFGHGAVDRHLLSRTDAQEIADMHVRERNVLLGSVGSDTTRCLRLQPEERAYRGRSP
jgi:hypothetical protein